MYFNVNFNLFFKLIKVHLLVSALYIYQNARCNDKKEFFGLFYILYSTVFAALLFLYYFPHISTLNYICTHTNTLVIDLVRTFGVFFFNAWFSVMCAMSGTQLLHKTWFYLNVVPLSVSNHLPVNTT